MIHIAAPTFASTFTTLCRLMRSAPEVRTERWQGKDVRNDKAAVMTELRNVVFEIDLLDCEKFGYKAESLRHWAEDTGANVPWADDHFLERTCGQPLNPGKEWANWPWATSAEKFQDDARFNHTYMERLWPKYARATADGKLPMEDEAVRPRKHPDGPKTHPACRSHRGIAWDYGDLRDIVDMLVAEPHTRQAWIPLFFPEDTGVADGGRKPCTLGYQFMIRNDRIHMWYPLRSCDLVRHWRDDCYLGVRLLQWVLHRCQEESDDVEFWGGIKLGTFAMHVTSLHIFANDLIRLKQGEKL